MTNEVQQLLKYYLTWFVKFSVMYAFALFVFRFAFLGKIELSQILRSKGLMIQYTLFASIGAAIFTWLHFNEEVEDETYDQE